MKLKTIALVAALTGVSVLAQAQFVGGVSIQNVGSDPTFSPTNDIGTATTFYIPDLHSFGGLSGVFAGSVALSGGGGQDYGSLTINLSTPSSASFTNAVFGYFVSTNIVVLDSQAGASIDLRAVGYYNSGTWDTNAIVGEAASIDFAFQKNGTAVSVSAPFTIPANPVPEPTTLALAALGGASLLLFRRRK